MDKIVVVCGRKKTDALICENLLKHFSEVKVLKYQIPYTNWFSWCFSSINKRGLKVFIGHLLLSFYIRFERFFENIQKKSIWQKYLNEVPSWQKVKATQIRCFNEAQLINNIEGFDLVFITDSFRLSHNFFRNSKAKFLEIVWGKLPNYGGDSGGFWAYSQGFNKDVAVTIVERNSQFNNLKILKEIAVKIDENETIRSIKVKQAVALANVLHHLEGKSKPVKKDLRVFCAPTLFTYLRFLKNKKLSDLPKYSYKILS